MKQVFLLTKTDISTYKVGTNFEINPEGTNLSFNFTPEALSELLEDYRESNDNTLVCNYADLQDMLNHVNRKLMPKEILTKLLNLESFAQKIGREIVFQTR